MSVEKTVRIVLAAERLQALPSRLIELAHQRRGAQLEQQARHLRGIAEAGLHERLLEGGRFRLAVPEAPEVESHGARGRLITPEDHRAEVVADARALRVERGEQRAPVLGPHGEGESLALEVSGGQAMHLRVAES